MRRKADASSEKRDQHHADGCVVTVAAHGATPSALRWSMIVMTVASLFQSGDQRWSLGGESRGDGASARRTSSTWGVSRKNIRGDLLLHASGVRSRSVRARWFTSSTALGCEPAAVGRAPPSRGRAPGSPSGPAAIDAGAAPAGVPRRLSLKRRNRWI